MNREPIVNAPSRTVECTTWARLAGAKTVTLLESEIPSHSHPLNANNTPVNVKTQFVVVPARSAGGTIYLVATPVPNQVTMAPEMLGIHGGDQPHNNLQPVLYVELLHRAAGRLPTEKLTPYYATPREEDAAIRLRPVRPGDMFLYEVYASTRQGELAVVPWDDAQKAAFLQMQFDAQHAHYQQHFAGAAFDIVLVDGQPAGRLYVARWPGGDPDHRRRHSPNVPQSPTRHAAADGFSRRKRPPHASRCGYTSNGLNPALRLYQRTGFPNASRTRVCTCFSSGSRIPDFPRDAGTEVARRVVGRLEYDHTPRHTVGNEHDRTRDRHPVSRVGGGHRPARAKP